jgi:hypothetical protein
MGFYDIHAGLAILAAARKIMLIQFVMMRVINIVHNVWLSFFTFARFETYAFSGI